MGYEIRRRTVLYVPERGLLKFFILCSRVSLSPVFRFFRALYLRKNLIQINQVRARPIRRLYLRKNLIQINQVRLKSRI